MQHHPDSRQGLFFWWAFRLVQAASMANPDPEHRLWPKMLIGIENQRIRVGYHLNRTVLSSLRLDLLRDSLKIIQDHTRSLASEERQLHLLQGGIEIHVEPSLHP